MLRLVLERVTHESISELVNGLIRESGLHNTFYSSGQYPEAVLKRLAHGYNYVGDMTATNGSWAQAAGAIISNPSDIAKWAQIFFKASKLDDQKYASYFLNNIKNGAVNSSLKESVYSNGVFRINTPEGLIWFTPGLMPGYTSMMVYVPCLNIYFSYSASKSDLKNFHSHVILKTLKVLKNYDKNSKSINNNSPLPEFCKNLKPAKEFSFPRIGG